MTHLKLEYAITFREGLPFSKRSYKKILSELMLYLRLLCKIQLKVTNQLLITTNSNSFLVSCSLGLMTGIIEPRLFIWGCDGCATLLKVETFCWFVLCSTQESSLTSLDKIK